MTKPTLEEYVAQHAATPDAYEATADALVIRMLETMRKHPEAAKLDDCWGMLKVDGFKCDDLGPSAFQAAWAFSKAKALFAKEAAK